VGKRWRPAEWNRGFLTKGTEPACARLEHGENEFGLTAALEADGGARMPNKSFTVYFGSPTIGDDAAPLGAYLNQLADENRSGHFPRVPIDGDDFQLREVARVGRVWQGVFARLRADAPHIVSAEDEEVEIDLEEGDSILDKCHFLYRERGNVLVWQSQRNVASFSRLRYYLHQLLGLYVQITYFNDRAELERVLNGDVRSVEFSWARSAADDALLEHNPRWNQSDLEMINSVHAAKAKVRLAGTRRHPLDDRVKELVRDLLGREATRKVTVKLTDETNPIELFQAPVKDTINVRLVGRYPVAREVFEGLEEAFGRQRRHLGGT